MKILLLCDYRPYNAATVCDHINAFYNLSIHEIFIYSGLVMNSGRLPDRINLNDFDAVVVHYSIFLAIDTYVSPHTRHRLKKYNGIKVIFIQDEYRFVYETVSHLKEIGFDLLFTCVPKSEIENVYPRKTLPKIRKINTLTGFVPAALLHYQPIPLAKRKFHVSYRGRRYPPWHGRLGREKWQIAEQFKKDARYSGLRLNISWKESKRLYGSDWTRLIQNSRAVLGVESGASVFDFTGEISARVETIYSLLKKKDLEKSKIHERYYKDQEDNIPLAQISPRIFEAIALRTLCVLYEGYYSGVLEPWKHYVPLKKDHSNHDEVVKILKDDERVAEMITNAYSDIGMNGCYSYRTFIKKFDHEVLELSKSGKFRSGRKKPVFPDHGSFYEAFPFISVYNPHGLKIPVRSKLISNLTPRIPVRFKMKIKRILGQQ